MAISSLALQLQPIYHHLEKEGKSYLLAGSLVLTACAVQAAWGKIGMLCFVATAVTSYPYLRKKIHLFSNLARDAKIQALSSAGIALVSFYSPVLGGALGGILGFLILERDMSLSEQVDKGQKEIERLGKQNKDLEKLYDDMQSNVKKLEQQIGDCWKIAEHIEIIVNKQAEGEQILQEVNAQTDSQFKQIEMKVTRLAALCELVKSNPQMMERMSVAKRIEEDLASMTQECSVRQQELKNLTEEIRGLKDELGAVLAKMSNEDTQLRGRIQVLLRCHLNHVY